jgi:hypothetical protein
MVPFGFSAVKSHDEDFAYIVPSSPKTWFGACHHPKFVEILVIER